MGYIKDVKFPFSDLSMLHVTFCGIGSQLVSEEDLEHMRLHYTQILREVGTDFRLYRYDF